MVRVNPLRRIAAVQPQRVAATQGPVLSGTRRRVAIGQAAALALTILVLAVDRQPTSGADLLAGLAIVLAFSGLRVLSVGRSTARSTLLLDGIGSAIVLAGTGAPGSSLFFLGLAGAWWAAHVSREHSGLTYSTAFGAAYVLLVVPDALRAQVLVLALEDVAVVMIVGFLSDWFVRIDRRAVELSEALAGAPNGTEELALRAGLTRALGVTEVPVDIVLAAGRAGLTVIQAELLAYLSMGLTNQEIADATNVSEATVRYRLTRLYRRLDVRGRKAAVTRARKLGLALADERR